MTAKPGVLQSKRPQRMEHTEQLNNSKTPAGGPSSHSVVVGFPLRSEGIIPTLTDEIAMASPEVAVL